jgi:hypothetical protein
MAEYSLKEFTTCPPPAVIAFKSSSDTSAFMSTKTRSEASRSSSSFSVGTPFATGSPLSILAA